MSGRGWSPCFSGSKPSSTLHLPVFTTHCFLFPTTVPHLSGSQANPRPSQLTASQDKGSRAHLTDGKTEVLGDDMTCSRARPQQPVGLWPHLSAPPPPHLWEPSAGTAHLHIPVGSPARAHLLPHCLLRALIPRPFVRSFIPSFIQLANHPPPHARPLPREMRGLKKERARLLVSKLRGGPAVCPAAWKVPYPSRPTAAVLTVLTASQGLYQDPIPHGKSWGESRTLWPQFPHLYMGTLRASSHGATVGI